MCNVLAQYLNFEHINTSSSAIVPSPLKGEVKGNTQPIAQSVAVFGAKNNKWATLISNYKIRLK
jgi:hypothetical protein